MGNATSLTLPIKRVHVSYPCTKQKKQLTENIMRKITEYNFDISYTDSSYNEQLLKTAEFVLIILNADSATNFTQVSEIQYCSLKFKHMLFIVTDYPNEYQNLLSNKTWIHYKNDEDFSKIKAYCNKYFSHMEN